MVKTPQGELINVARFSSIHSAQMVESDLPKYQVFDCGAVVPNALSVWDAIDMYADVVFESPDFLELSHAALCDILCRDGLSLDEFAVYNSVHAWVQAECHR